MFTSVIIAVVISFIESSMIMSDLDIYLDVDAILVGDECWDGVLGVGALHVLVEVVGLVLLGVVAHMSYIVPVNRFFPYQL